MPTNEEIVDAIWNTVINGVQARRIFEAFFGYIRARGAVVDSGYGGALSWRSRNIARQRHVEERPFEWGDYIAADDEEVMTMVATLLGIVR